MHTQQDVIPCAGLMVQQCLNPSLPINDHVPYTCAVRVARVSRSILPLRPLTVPRRIIHLHNWSDKQMDKSGGLFIKLRRIICLIRIIQWITLFRLIIRL